MLRENHKESGNILNFIICIFVDHLEIERTRWQPNSFSVKMSVTYVNVSNTVHSIANITFTVA